MKKFMKLMLFSLFTVHLHGALESVAAELSSQRSQFCSPLEGEEFQECMDKQSPAYWLVMTILGENYN